MFNNNRILKAKEKFGESILHRFFVTEEIDYALKSVNWHQRLGARFAAKVAFFQAMNVSGQIKRDYRQIEIKKNELGAPYIQLGSALLCDFNKTGANKTYLTISHIKDYSIANVIFEN